MITPHNYAFTNWFASRNQQRAYRMIETALAPLATRTLCVCEAEGRLARRLGPPSRVRVVHNGIHPLREAEPDPDLTEFRGAGRLVCAITEFSPPKGIPTLIEAMGLLRDQHPGFRLAIAGDGPTRDEVTFAIERAGVGRNVRLFGQVESPAAVLAASDVFVSPGWSESFPYAILEAMSAEMPIVATDVGGVGEAIEDGVTGRLVPPQDLRRWQARSRRPRKILGEARAMGARAGERMRSQFTFEKMIDGTLSIYRELGVP